MLEMPYSVRSRYLVVIDRGFMPVSLLVILSPIKVFRYIAVSTEKWNVLSRFMPQAIISVQGAKLWKCLRVPFRCSCFCRRIIDESPCKKSLMDSSQHDSSMEHFVILAL